MKSSFFGTRCFESLRAVLELRGGSLMMREPSALTVSHSPDGFGMVVGGGMVMALLPQDRDEEAGA